jgi:hypothetical protein
LPTLLSSVSHLLGHSAIVRPSNNNEPELLGMGLYTAHVKIDECYKGSKIIQQALLAIENYFEMPAGLCQITENGTIEAIYEILHNSSMALGNLKRNTTLN